MTDKPNSARALGWRTPHHRHCRLAVRHSWESAAIRVEQTVPGPAISPTVSRPSLLRTARRDRAVALERSSAWDRHHLPTIPKPILEGRRPLREVENEIAGHITDFAGSMRFRLHPHRVVFVVDSRQWRPAAGYGARPRAMGSVPMGDEPAIGTTDSWSLSGSDAGPSSLNGSPMFKPQVRRNCAASAAISTAIGWLCRLDSRFTGARSSVEGNINRPNSVSSDVLDQREANVCSTMVRRRRGCLARGSELGQWSARFAGICTHESAGCRQPVRL